MEGEFVITTTQPGYFTTIQDEGRWGYQAYGMPISGAMDRYAYRVANLLVGNQINAAVLEMTGIGATLKFDEQQLVAVCGAEMQGLLNGKSITNWSAFTVPKRGEIKFDVAINGYRTYLAIHGGFDVPLVLDSRSTCPWAKVGGYEGRILRQGDVLYVGQDSEFITHPRKLDPLYLPQYGNAINLRVILGLQDSMFTQETIQTFFENIYVVTNQSDRTGYHLEGPRIKHIDNPDIISDAACLGAIQIPAHGMPFIMTADHQTTRGFAKLGSVIQVDLSKLAQGKTGDSIRFILVTEEEAITALCIERQSYIRITKLCQDSDDAY